MTDENSKVKKYLVTALRVVCALPLLFCLWFVVFMGIMGGATSGSFGDVCYFSFMLILILLGVKIFVWMNKKVFRRHVVEPVKINKLYYIIAFIVGSLSIPGIEFDIIPPVLSCILSWGLFAIVLFLWALRKINHFWPLMFFWLFFGVFVSSLIFPYFIGKDVTIGAPVSNVEDVLK